MSQFTSDQTPGLRSALIPEQELERLRAEVNTLRAALEVRGAEPFTSSKGDLPVCGYDLFSFIPEGGETGALIRSIDWDRHPLGNPRGWLPTLKITLGTMLGSRHPMFLWYGPDLIQFYNDAYMPSFGNGKHPQAMGQPGRKCWPEIWDIIGPQINDVMSRGKPSWNINHLVPIHRNGQIEDVYWTYGFSPVRDPDGKIVGTLVVCTETTSQVLSAAAVESEREKLRSIFLQAPVGICVMKGPEHVYTLTNPVWYTLLSGGESRDILGKPVRQALPELEGQGIYELLDQVYQTGVPFVGKAVPVEISQLDGSLKHFYLDFVYTPKRDANGKTEGILCVFTDVTEQQLAIEKLKSEQTLRERFVAALTHDLRTPLTAAKMSAQLLMRKADEPSQKLASRIAHNMDRADDMIRDLLDASRFKVGEKIPLTIQDCDLTAVVRSTVDNLTSIHGDRFILSGDGQDLAGYWDPSALQRIVENLAGNAVKYGSVEKAILIKVSLGESKCNAEIAIQNEGTPILPEDLATLFEPYRRAEAAARSGQKGWGIGLTLVRGLAEAHGGHVSVKSTESDGTTFKVCLPLDARQALL